MNNNNNYRMYQQGNLYSINGSVPIAYINPNPLINANLVPNVYVNLQNSNKNVAQLGYNPTLPNTNRIQNIYNNPVNLVPSSIMKNQIVPMNNMNIIQTQQMNKNNANILPIGNNNLIKQRYNPPIQSRNLINYGNNPVEKSNINMIHQKSKQMINNNNQLPVTFNILYNPKIISNNPNKSNKEDEVNSGHKKLDINITTKAMKSICKITIYYNNGIIIGTGFFMKISDSLKYLITNCLMLDPKLINKNIKIE